MAYESETGEPKNELVNFFVCQGSYIFRDCISSRKRTSASVCIFNEKIIFRSCNLLPKALCWCHVLAVIQIWILQCSAMSFLSVHTFVWLHRFQMFKFTKKGFKPAHLSLLFQQSGSAFPQCFSLCAKPKTYIFFFSNGFLSPFSVPRVTQNHNDYIEIFTEQERREQTNLWVCCLCSIYFKASGTSIKQRRAMKEKVDLTISELGDKNGEKKNPEFLAAIRLHRFPDHDYTLQGIMCIVGK